MYFEEIQIGDYRTIPETPVCHDDMLHFSQVYNPHPVHVDEEFAKTTRAGKILASGVYTFLLGWAHYVMQDFGGTETLAGTEIRMQFFAPVFAGDTLHGKAFVADAQVRNPYNGSIDVQVDLYNQHEELVLRSHSSEIVKRKSPAANLHAV